MAGKGSAKNFGIISNAERGEYYELKRIVERVTNKEFTVEQVLYISETPWSIELYCFITPRKNTKLDKYERELIGELSRHNYMLINFGFDPTNFGVVLTLKKLRW